MLTRSLADLKQDLIDIYAGVYVEVPEVKVITQMVINQKDPRFDIGPNVATRAVSVITYIADFIKRDHNLAAEEVVELQQGLKLLQPSNGGFSSRYIDTHSPTVADIDLVCKHYKTAQQVARLITWMYRYDVHKENIAKLQAMDFIAEDLLNLAYVKVSRDKFDLAKLLFDSFVAPISFSLSPTTVMIAPIAKLKKTYPMSLEDLQNIIAVYKKMKDADQLLVLNKPTPDTSYAIVSNTNSDKSLTADKVKALIEELDKLSLQDSAQELPMISGEHLYAIACILAAACQPTTIERIAPEEFSELQPYLSQMDDETFTRTTSLPVPAEYLKQRLQDNNNKAAGKTYLDKIFGVPGGAEISLSCWRPDGIFHKFDYSWIEQFIELSQVQPEHLSNFTRAANVLGARCFGGWCTTIEDLHYITLHLMSAPVTKDYARYDSYCYPNLNPQAFKLAVTLRWLGLHDLETAENKARVYENIDEFHILNDITGILGRSDRCKSFNQKVFDIVAYRIQKELAFKNLNQSVVPHGSSSNIVFAKRELDDKPETPTAAKVLRI